MTRKSIIILLAAAVVTGALVFDGLSHRHGNQSSSQNPPVTAIPASAPSGASNIGTGAQPTAPASDTTTATNPGQSAGPAGASQPGQDGAVADAAQPAADDAPAAAQPIIVPAGTTLTVRLAEDLGSRISEMGQRFSATLDNDVVVNGETVIAAGAAVFGKVVLARPAGAVAGEAILQLKVTGVNVNNANLTVVTSLRSFGPQIKGKNKVGKFMKGLVKRASGEEREVLLAQQSAYNFTLQRRLEIQ
jgi:hypothetical protein